MILTDLNGSIKPPANFTLENIIVEGAYLILSYEQQVFVTDTMTIKGHNRILLYVNDMGREVMRLTDFVPLLEQTMDWSTMDWSTMDWSTNPLGQQAGHQPYPSWKEIFKFVWRRLS
jgi:hypothetical protein